MNAEKAPWVDAALVEYLDRLYPDRLLALGRSASEREVWLATGRAQVVAKLRAMTVEQTEQA